MKISGGTKGTSFNDMQLAGKVRGLALKRIQYFLEKDFDKKKNPDDWEFQRQLLLKLSANTLPRLNEHTGLGGGPLSIMFDNSFNAVTSETEDNRRE